jgi:transcriptional regulator with XRE-family HTH domain
MSLSAEASLATGRGEAPGIATIVDDQPVARLAWGERREIATMIGRQLRCLRRQRAISLAEVSQRIGVSIQQLHKYELGINLMPIDRIMAFCSVFATDAAELLREVGAELHRAGHPVAEPGAAVPAEERIRLVAAYAGLPDPDVRRHVVELLEAMGSGLGLPGRHQT